MSGAAPEAKHESAPPAAGGGGGSSKLLLILTGVNLIAVLGMVGILYTSFQRDSQKPSIEDVAAGAAAGEHGGKAEGGHGEAKAEGGHGEAKPEGGHGAAKAEGGHGEAKAEGGHGEGGHGEAGHSAPKKSSEFGKMITLDPFTVNLSTPGSVNPKFVRVNISLEVPNDETEGEVTAKMPQIRNAVIDLFNSKRPGDLATADGRDYLKEEIRNALNTFLVTGKVKGVFFTNFAMSS